MRDPFALVPPAKEQKTGIATPLPRPLGKVYLALGILVGIVVILIAAVFVSLRRTASADVIAQNYSATVKIELPNDEKINPGDSYTSSLTVSNQGMTQIVGRVNLCALGATLDLSAYNKNLKSGQAGYASKLSSDEQSSFNLSGCSGYFIEYGPLGSSQEQTFPIKFLFSGGGGTQVKIAAKVINNINQEVSCGALNLGKCNRVSSAQIGSDSFQFKLSNRSKVVLKRGYNFVTLPYTFSLDATRSFTSLLKSKWGYYYKTSTPEYLDLFKNNNSEYIKAGNGFWVYSENGEEILLPEQRVETNPSDTFRINLDVGWNQIGNPYTKSITLDPQKIIFQEAAEDGSASGAMYSYQNAYDNKVLSNVYNLVPKTLMDSSGSLSNLTSLMEWKVLPIGSTLKSYVGAVIKSEKKGTLVIPGKDVITACGLITDDEWSKIQEWLSRNGLNRYGDPEGTVYSQGSPVDKNGIALDECDSILKNHADKPWLKNSPQ